MVPRPSRIHLRFGSLFLVALCAAIPLWTAAYPFSRAFILAEIDYNEGWNVYNAQKIAEHQPLYPTTYGWTSVNYPPLSFHLVAWLGSSTSDFLFTGRMLSLAGLCLCALFAGLIVLHTTESRSAAWLSGIFLVAYFCAMGNSYVGMDDPQILAQAFFMAGIYVYLRGNREGWAPELTALLFVVGGNIKHNLIEFPLAVLLDLLLSSPRRALRFAAGGGLMAAFSILLTRQIDGAAYLSCLLTARSYSPLAGIRYMLFLPRYGPLPAAAALYAAWFCLRDPSRRILGLLLFCAIAVDAYFCGGSGVDVNGLFGTMLAIIVLNGLFWFELGKLPLGPEQARSPLVFCSVFLLSLSIPVILLGNARPDKEIEESRAETQRFATEVAYLKEQPGPSLCESILLCAYAGKPYVYDPFNATRFIKLGELDSNVIVEQLRNHAYGSIQLYGTVGDKLGDPDAQYGFVPPILEAIGRYYVPGMDNQDGVIYIPRAE